MQTLLVLLFISLFLPGQGGPEIVSFRTARLNDSLPGVLARQRLMAALGKPTRIEDFEGECALTDDQEKAKTKKLYYYNGTKFFVYDNTAELMLIDFRSGKFSYKTPGLRLSAATTFQDIQNTFPNSARAAIIENKATMVRLSPCKDCDGQLLLYFEKGKLVQLEWWEPC